MPDTPSFIASAQLELQDALASGSLDERSIANLFAWSNGVCVVCGNQLELMEETCSSDQVSYHFRCGHSFHKQAVGGQISPTSTLRAHSLSVDLASGLQKTQARATGQVPKTVEEQSAARRWNEFAEKGFSKFTNENESSDIDVIAESDDGRRETIQVTQLYRKEFWKPLNTTGAVDLITKELAQLLEDAIQLKKKHYPSEQRRAIVLLIDAWTGIFRQFAEASKMQLSETMSKSGFKEIWFVGDKKERTFQLWP